MILEPYCKLKPNSFRDITLLINRKNSNISNENNINYKNKFSKSPDNKNFNSNKFKNKPYNPSYKDNTPIYNNYIHNMHVDTSLYSVTNTNITTESIYSRNTMNDSN